MRRLKRIMPIHAEFDIDKAAAKATYPEYILGQRDKSQKQFWLSLEKTAQYIKDNYAHYLGMFRASPRAMSASILSMPGMDLYIVHTSRKYVMCVDFIRGAHSWDHSVVYSEPENETYLFYLRTEHAIKLVK